MTRIGIVSQFILTKLLLCLSFVNLSCALEIIIAWDDFSKKNLNEESIFEIYQAFPSVEFHECNLTSIGSCVIEYPDSSALLDFSVDAEIQFSISKICEEFTLIHLFYQDKLSYKGRMDHSITPSEEEQLNAFLAILRHFNWTQGAFIGNKSKLKWKQQIFEFSKQIEFMMVESETNIKEFVNRLVFPLGSTLYYIFTDPFESPLIQSSLEYKKLIDLGDGIVLDQDSGYSCIYNGTLIITRSGFEFSASVEDYFKSSIIKIIDFLQKNEFSGNMVDLLNSQYTQDQFSIINIQNGKRKIVGSIISHNVTIFKDLEFPGFSTSVPKSMKKILHLSINAGSSNPGTPPIPNAMIGSRGAFAIQDKINEGNDILSHFHIDFFNYDCGVTVFNATFTKSCFIKDINHLGLSHISGFGSAIAIGSLKIFKQLNISIATVGATNADDSLNSTVNYPMYSRVQMSNSFIYSKYPILLKGMGWKSAVILYQNDVWGLSAYTRVKQFSDYYGFTLVNPENLRFIPGNLDREGLKNYTNVLKNIIESQVRLLILLIQYPLGNYVLEQLYELGVRRGDFVICAGYPDHPTFISINDTYLYKRLEVGIPMFTIVSEAWSGDFGQDALHRILSKYHSEPNAFSCYYVDAAYLIASALDYMINRGYDYTDSIKLMLAIRNTRFRGCTGRVSIEKDSNDRIVEWMVIQGVKTTEKENTIIYIIGDFRPFSSQVISIINPMIYGDGSTQKPTDLRNVNSKCPFPDKQVKTFEKGRLLLFGICFTVALIMIFITFYIWKRWWNISVEPLIKKEELSIQDAIVGLSIAIEFFQYSSMGPDFKIISSFLANFSNLFSLKLEDMINLEKGVFWWAVDIVFGGIGLWVVLCVVVIFQLDEKFLDISLFRFLRWLSDFMMPVLGNLCFIPFISVCLDIFQCDQSIGDNFTDSFLSKDCYYFCWKGEHLIYAIISLLALIFYEPLAVFCRPLWQELQPTLHVKTVPLFLMVKTVVQTTLIVLDGTVKRSTQIAHGIIFIIVMIAYVAFIFKFKPYNYPRFSWWQALSIIGIVWLALLSLIGLEINDRNIEIPLLVSLFIGWVIIIAIGLYIQKKKYPSMLFRKKGHDTNTLFKFAFTFGKTSKISLSKITAAPKSEGFII